MPARIRVVVLAALLLAACGASDGTTADTAPPRPVDPSTSTTAERPDTPGCDAPAAPGTEVEHTIDVDGTDRTYLLTVPEGDGRPMPLLVNFHGMAEGAAIEARMTEFSAVAEREAFAVAFPNGTHQPIRWAVNTSEDVDGDRAFVAAMLDEIGADHCIDPTRVYAAGLSNGAMMSSVVACTMSDRFAAVAAVAGVMSPEPCPVERPVPLVVIHGTSDPILSFNGVVDVEGLTAALSGQGDNSDRADEPYDIDGPGYPAAVRAWAARNGCAPTPTDTDLTDEVLHRVYDCPDDADVEFYVIRGGGHSWPSSEFSARIERMMGHTTFDIDGPQVAWDFVSRFRLPED